MVKCTPRPPHLWFYLALLIMFSKCHYDFYKCDSCLLLHPYSPGKTISIEPAQVLSRFGLTPECLTLCNSMAGPFLNTATWWVRAHEFGGGDTIQSIAGLKSHQTTAHFWAELFESFPLSPGWASEPPSLHESSAAPHPGTLPPSLLPALMPVLGQSCSDMHLFPQYPMDEPMLSIPPGPQHTVGL